MRVETRGSVAFILLLAFGLGCSGAASGPARSPADRPLPGKSSVDHLEERALLLLLADRRAYEPLVVRRSLAGPPDLREELAGALGRSGDPRALDPLLGLLIDDSVPVRRAAAFALGELGEKLPVARIEERRRAAAGLLDAAAGSDRAVAVLAVEALGKLEVTLATVLGRLDELPAAERTARLVPFLYRFPDPQMPQVARDGLEAEDTELRYRALLALALNPTPESLPIFRSLVVEAVGTAEAAAGDLAASGPGGSDEPDARLAAWAARGIGRVGGSDRGRTGSAARDLELLRPLLDWRPVTETAPVLAALRAARSLIGDGRAAAPAGWRDRLADLLDDPRPGVRRTAIDAASVWLLDERLGDLLAARARGGDGIDGMDRIGAAERGAALVSLATGGDPRAEELAAAAAVSTDEWLRTAAAEAAGVLGAVAVLETLGEDPAPRVREAVFSARVALAPRGSTARVARRALEDPDPGVRAAVLGWLADRPVLPVAALERAARRAFGRPGERSEGTAGSGSVDERLAAVGALVARAAVEAPGSAERRAAESLLLDLATEGSYAVRGRTAEGLARLGSPRPSVGPVDSGRSVAVYRRIVLETREPRFVEIRTERGPVRVRLACPRAPVTCVSFLRLAGQGFYDGLSFHGVAPGFAIQGGDPRGDGKGGPGYTLRDEVNRLRFDGGVLGMALAGSAAAPDSGGSRFFITLAPRPRLDGTYTAFGEVIAGEEVVRAIQPGDRIETIREVGRWAR